MTTTVPHPMQPRFSVEELRGKTIHVVGLAGTEGAAVVDFLLAQGLGGITAHDLRRPDEFLVEFTRTHQWLPSEQREAAARRLLGAPITICWADRYLAGIDQADIVFVPQAWFRYPANAPLKRLKARGVRWSSMTQLFFEVSPCAIIGVTGTNGKFTVAHLIHQMLVQSGRRAFFSGNDRSHVPMLYYAEEIRPQDWLVLELSNRQLIDLPYSPQIAVITNIVPHHLDDHGTLDAYVEVKRTVLKFQGPDDLAVLNADNPYTAAIADRCAHPFLFSRTHRIREGAYVDGETIVVTRGRLQQEIPLGALQVPGPHSVENALAACLTAALAGGSAVAMADVLSEFRGLPYRYRLVADVAGVRYYEDSLATNPEAAAAAIASMDRSFVLIAGGARPNAAAEDFAPMRTALRTAPVKRVLLIGATAPQLHEALAGLPVSVVGTLERAMTEAKRLVRSGEAVLLSPGCESFDQFRDYRQRGDRYAELVQAAAPAQAGS